MFNLGGPELVVIIIVALIVLGPQQLPKAMRTFGSVMAEIRKVSSTFQEEMRSAMDSVDTTGTEKPQSGSMAAATPAATPASDGPGAAVDGPSEPAPASPSEAPQVDEVAGRNDAQPEAPAPDEDARPAVDPADRAAG